MYIGFMILFIACSKDEDEPTVPTKLKYVGNSIAVINKDTIPINSYVSFENNEHSVSLFYNSINGYRLFQFDIFNFSLMKKGKQKIEKPISHLLGYYRGADAVVGFYDLIQNDSIEDYIEVTDYNVQTKEVTGNVQGSFKLKFINPNYPIPDTVVFRNCTFKSKINE
jgi:hypothetical protein